jgi:hypothetical protein
VPLASSIVFQIASVGVLVSAVGLVAIAFRERGQSERTPTRLERAQTVSIAVAAIALGIYGLFDLAIANAIWVVAVFVTLAITAARWRKNEPLLPDWL